MKLINEKKELNITKIYDVNNELKLFVNFLESDGKIKKFNYYFFLEEKSDFKFKMMEKEKFLKDLENYKKICYARSFNIEEYLLLTSKFLFNFFEYI